MENISMICEVDSDEQMELPPGFRFHPTDEELITHYLSYKVLDNTFCCRAIGEVDLNKCEPWDLPLRAKMGEKEWYFFCIKDKKYPTGSRTNRATDAGYWKATGKDREIFKGKTLVGMKKTLVFYKGRAPKGEKTNWIMHEYRLEEKQFKHIAPKAAKKEWVICRVFPKNPMGKKTNIPGSDPYDSYEDYLSPSTQLPPLMDFSSYNNETITSMAESNHVTCFSNPMEEKQMYQHQTVHNFNTSSSSNHRSSIQDSVFMNEIGRNEDYLQYPDSSFNQEQFILKMLMDNQGSNTTRISKPEVLDEFVVLNNETNFPRLFEDPSSSVGPIKIDCLWSY